MLKLIKKKWFCYLNHHSKWRVTDVLCTKNCRHSTTKSNELKQTLIKEFFTPEEITLP